MHVNQKMTSWNNMWHPGRHLWFFFGAIYLHCSPGISLARRQLARLGGQPGIAYLWTDLWGYPTPTGSFSPLQAAQLKHGTTQIHLVVNTM